MQKYAKLWYFKNGGNCSINCGKRILCPFTGFPPSREWRAGGRKVIPAEAGIQVQCHSLLSLRINSKARCKKRQKCRFSMSNESHSIMKIIKTGITCRIDMKKWKKRCCRHTYAFNFFLFIISNYRSKFLLECERQSLFYPNRLGMNRYHVSLACHRLGRILDALSFVLWTVFGSWWP